MNDLLGIIFANDQEAKLNELIFHRADAAIPVAGRYRLIDFALSNCVNSSITKIAIITKSNYLSLMDHIRMGRDWDLNRKNSGIAVFPPYVSNNSKTMYKGKIDALEGIIDYLSRAKEEYVLITNGNIVANINFEEIYQKHIKNNADITVLTYKEKTNGNRVAVINKSEKGVIKEVVFSNSISEEKQELSLSTYIIKKDLLVAIINGAYSKGFSDLEELLLQKEIHKYKVCKEEIKGYVAVINTVKTYYDKSMELLKEENRSDLFFKNGKIFTKVKDSVPVIYGDNCNVKNSLIADGCTINGSVENSILFRNVVVEEGVEIKNSIIMEYTVVKKGSKISCTITDKDVLVKEDRVISGHETYPVVIAKGKEV